MGTHSVRKLDDGTHALVGDDGHVPTVTDPETGARQIASGFDSAAEARKAGESSGIDVKSPAPARKSSGSKSSTRKTGARRN